MLVLSRKTNQRILIGDTIEVVVLDVRNGRVRLGFKCPDSVVILRGELLEQGARKPAHFEQPVAAAALAEADPFAHAATDALVAVTA